MFQIISVKTYTVFVKLSSGRTLSIGIDNVSQIRRIKEQIESHEGIPASRQQLKVGEAA